MALSARAKKLVAEITNGKLKPPELATAEKYLQSAILGLPQFRLRRWIITQEGWDEDDNYYLRILSEGDSPESVHAEQGQNSP